MPITSVDPASSLKAGTRTLALDRGLPQATATTIETVQPLTFTRLLATAAQPVPFASLAYGATGGPNTTLLFSGEFTLTAPEQTVTYTEAITATETFSRQTVTQNATGQ